MVKKIGKIEYDETPANKLGEGGFGLVFKGSYRCSKHGNLIVAVKIVKVDYLSQKTMEDELLKLNHDNIVRLFHTEDDDNNK